MHFSVRCESPTMAPGGMQVTRGDMTLARERMSHLAEL